MTTALTLPSCRPSKRHHFLFFGTDHLKLGLTYIQRVVFNELGVVHVSCWRLFTAARMELHVFKKKKNK